MVSLGVGAGSSILSGIFGSNAADKAAQQQATAAKTAADLAGTSTNIGTGAITHAVDTGQAGISTAQQQQNALLQPYIQSGQNATNSLTQFANSTPQQFSFNPSDLASDPGYQFTLQQGQQALQRSAAAQGGLFSSGTLKALANYTTGTANTYFNDAYNRAANTFGINRQSALDRVNTLTGLSNQGYGATGTDVTATGQNAQQSANIGLTGASQIANTSLQGSQQKGNFLTQMGNAQAGGTIGSNNAWMNTLQGGTNSLIGYLNKPNNYQLTPNDLGWNNIGTALPDATSTVPGSGGEIPQINY